MGKLILSALVVVLNFSIAYLFTIGNKKKTFSIIGLILLIAIVWGNHIYEVKNEIVLIIILMFSVAIIVALIFNKLSALRFKNKISSIEMDNKLAKKFLRIKNVFFSYILPVMLTIYQLLLIWSDKLSNEMISGNESNVSVHSIP